MLKKGGMVPRSTEFDKGPEDLEIRCPRLGGTVPFGYCMAPGEQTPCHKIFDCWWEVFDVASYLKGHLPRETIEKLVQDRSPSNRLNTILELVQKFKSTKPGQNGNQ